jgi:hypothetical protein
MMGMVTLRALRCPCSLKPPFACVNQPKVLVTSEHHQVVTATNSRVNRIARRLLVHTGGSVAARRKAWLATIHGRYFRGFKMGSV